MPYIGMFTEENIQAAINHAADKLGDGKSGMVAHIDNQGEVSLSVVHRFGEHVSVEAIGIMNASEGFKFDKSHLTVQAELIAEW